MTVRSIIEEPLVIHRPGMTAQERYDKVLYLLDKVGLRKIKLSVILMNFLEVKDNGLG